MISIGILGPSEIASRRFLPALLETNCFQFIGVASANDEEWFALQKSNENSIQNIRNEKEKAKLLSLRFGGKLFDSYSELINSNEVDAIYIPLPPGLHYKWAREALLKNKHVLLEKPATVSFEDTLELVNIADQRNLAIFENYAYLFHDQVAQIEKIIEAGTIGSIRLYRISFGFPMRNINDFRYNKELGGGALLDCGGYTLNYARKLLGKGAKIVSSHLNYIEGFDVDIYGSATLINEQGITAQISFGMDNSYKCEFEAWGSKGSLLTDRIFSPPSDYEPKITLRLQDKIEILNLKADNSFKNSIIAFNQSIIDNKIRKESYKNILDQAEMIREFTSNIL